VTRSRCAAFVVAGAALAAGALGCAGAGPKLGGEPVRVSGVYAHPPTGALLPERIGALSRSGVTRWDDAETNVGASYDDGSRARITVYVYPAGVARAGRLLGEFAGASGTLQQLHPAALREASAIVRAPRPDGRAVGFEARFKLLDVAAGAPDRTLLDVFQCGRWFLKIRATHASDYPIDAALADVLAEVRCADLARKPPLGTAPTIDLDASLPGEGVSPAAEWIAHAAAQLAWIQEHVTPEDLAYGIPDQDPALWLSAWESTLEMREEIRRDGEAASDAFLDGMLAVRDAGFLEAYVWSIYLGFLPPPAALAPRVEDFERWRENALPAHRHEVRAAARLGDRD
jgi:hypothetical protein